MGKEKSAPAGFWSAIFQSGPYKRTQGKTTRQVTLAAIALVFAVGAYQLWAVLDASGLTTERFFGDNAAQIDPLVFGGVPLMVFALGIWLGYRLVNYPQFADFLIAVDAEMNKVSWPTRTELVRSAIVVIFLIFSLAFLLYAYDALWQGLFLLLRISS